MAEQHHNYTALLILIYALLVLMGAIFFTISQSKVTGLDEYKAGSSKLNSAKNNLIVAYILGYIAAGMGILLAIIYFGHVAWGIQNEIPHLIIFILLFLLVIVSGIFGFIALSNINGSEAVNRGSATNWIWAAEVVGLIALIVLIISGAWRAQYVSTRPKTSKKTTVDLSAQQELTFTAPETVNYEPTPQVYSAPSYVAPTYSAPTYSAPTYSAPGYSSYSTSDLN
jgi:hypothetical protein